MVSSQALEALRSEFQRKDRAMARVLLERSGKDLSAAAAEVDELKAAVQDTQRRLDVWTAEHGTTYEQGIVPLLVGQTLKARQYDSWWNWAAQDLVELFHRLVYDVQEQPSAAWVQSRVHALERRSTSRLVSMVKSIITRLESLSCDKSRRLLAERVLGQLLGAVEAGVASEVTVFRHAVVSTSPVLRYGADGRLLVEQKVRVKASTSLGSYCRSEASYDSSHSSRDEICSATSTTSSPSSPDGSYAATTRVTGTPFIKTLDERDGWLHDKSLSASYNSWFNHAATSGISFSDQTVLITGAGRNSIGAEMLSLLLCAGAQVVVTTSSYSPETLKFYQELYRLHGARGSRLVVLPFNAASQQDVEALVTYIYKTLGWELDYVVPFAAISETGRGVDKIDSMSELAHRAMLTNVLRLLGAIKAAKEVRRIWTHPTYILLPLSPNHGSFGQDGLYAESKMSLEALLNKWSSEGWQDFLSLCGAAIGWTRGTGLMAGNDTLAAGVEADLGLRTFSTPEMAWHLVDLLHSPAIRVSCDSSPIMADLSGGMMPWMRLRSVLDQIKRKMHDRSEIERALSCEGTGEQQQQQQQQQGYDSYKMAPRARLQVDQMELPEWSDIQPLAKDLRGMVDLDKVVVVVGFGEVGPCGSSRTRWELESTGSLSIEGCLELAWIMGLVEYHQGPLPGNSDSKSGNGGFYSGWIETETKIPVTDQGVKDKYESYIRQHTGIRMTERKDHDLSTPGRQQELQEIILERDLEPLAVSAETAAEMKVQHGDKVMVTESPEGQVLATLKAGAAILVPKAIPCVNSISAQLPTGWDARRYGVPDDIVKQVDPLVLFALVAASEAFLSAGITDPFDMYKELGCSVADVGNCLGTSVGRLRSAFHLYKGRYLQRNSQADILAETFPNTAAAWLNMLLLGAAGPIRTPVGACATSLESLDAAYDLVAGGKAKFVIAGGADGIESDISLGFAHMSATVDATREAARGRSPREASRPMASTRAGFVESEGCGVQILCTARTAIDLGLPIHGVIAMTHTASDGIGTSLPPPGKGILTSAAEYHQTVLAQISRTRDDELAWIKQNDQTDHEKEQRRADAMARAKVAETSARRFYCSPEFYAQDASISSLRGALAVWGLTIDDLDVASLHGTSTVLGDLNETAVLQKQLSHLGRSAGNPIACVCQKAVVGHGKACAAAFATNGSLQIMTSPDRIVPGNPNADNIDEKLQDRDLLYFPGSKHGIGKDLVKAFTVTSFGFGQKGAQIVGVNPNFLFAALEGREQFEQYIVRCRHRRARANRSFQEALYGGGEVRGIVKVKSSSVFAEMSKGQGLEEFLLERR
ncbi:hypothetical protein MCOR21_011639 [Pyricularia oryzae]|nr:hypothetical protein MCOR19_011269 [Pyricularia oryzae]KAI6264406.1 hypothetical protein MCOR26_011367 [Pyricularia oryzae]KAI6392006.1 hypothetical protein MCOR20_011231 [Pyricularia oryzae]KAI6414025.1 hypothetical protein MCOR21_011639 [Pyricularia oryzae]KAI6456825.1 hypothetical protein MCOR15_007051 [Pyricularia oryzae]